MKIILSLVLALSIHSTVMAQNPVAPAPGAPESPNSPDDKALVDQNHKPESVFEGQGGTPTDKSKNFKGKKHLKKKKHHGKKHRKHKKSQE